MGHGHARADRVSQPEEITNLILYLHSDPAALITGPNGLLDGGRRCGVQR